MGIGRRLLEHLIERAADAGADRLFLEVRPSNAPALHMYREAGFQIIGLRKGYYKAIGGHEDAAVLVYRFNDPR